MGLVRNESLPSLVLIRQSSLELSLCHAYVHVGMSFLQFIEHTNELSVSLEWVFAENESLASLVPIIQ